MNGILWLTVVSPIEVAPMRVDFVGANHLHCTLSFGVVPTPDDIWRLGEEVTLTVTSVCWNADIQALTVELPKGWSSSNAIPHITLYHREGVAPFLSNSMLEGEHQSLPLNVELNCIYEFLEW